MTDTVPDEKDPPADAADTDPAFDDQAAVLARLPIADLHTRMGIELVEARPERVVGRMPVAGNTQPQGLLHGGASCVLAEGLGSYAAAIHALPDRVAVGVDINATHHRAVRSGYVTGVATPVHRGHRTASYQIVITDEDGRRICTARITCLLQPVDRQT